MGHLRVLMRLIKLKFEEYVAGKVTVVSSYSLERLPSVKVLLSGVTVSRLVMNALREYYTFAMSSFYFVNLPHTSHRQ